MTFTEQAEILSCVISGRATASCQPPALGLDDLFAAHRVTGRALAYIERNGPAWADDPLMNRLTLDLDMLVTDPMRLVRDMKAANIHEYRKVSPHELINVVRY